jgi:hypothetical protein
MGVRAPANIDANWYPKEAPLYLTRALNISERKLALGSVHGRVAYCKADRYAQRREPLILEPHPEEREGPNA